MSLSPLDDYPIHQIAQPVRRVATSDRNFYDRYYFFVYNKDRSICMVAGLAVYPNLGVADGYAAIYINGKQRVVRASRELGSDRADVSVGPLKVDVLEGLKRLRVSLAPNEWNFDFDLTFDAAIPAQEEPNHFKRQAERVVMDTCRLAQTGYWSGCINIDGQSIDVDAETWGGCRDRSWGIRSVGEPEAPGIRAKYREGYFHLYAQVLFEDHSIIFMIDENEDGTRFLEESKRVWHDPSKPVEYLGRPEHELEFVPGTRHVKKGTLHLGHDANRKPVILTVDPGAAVNLKLGTGYGFEKDWRHGMYQGPLEIQYKEYEPKNVEENVVTGILDHVGLYEYDGHVGFGLWEVMFSGPYEKYGFTSWKDGYGEKKEEDK